MAIAYLTLPLAAFLIGWLQWWTAVPLMLCLLSGMRPLIAAVSPTNARRQVTAFQLTTAVLVGFGWAAFGGTDHLVFANSDWHTRDAVLHDLVICPWPVGYGLLDGKETLLRAPIAYYLPAAVIGKILGLGAAHVALMVWTAVGAALFLMQVLSMTPPRLGATLTAIMVVVLFSGLDIIGSLLNDGPRFRADWNITTHLEWWAGKYQYSSMTTQLFWVPNHAVGAWLTVGMLLRNKGVVTIDSVLPISLVALALWSPFAVIGVVPFVLWKVIPDIRRMGYSGMLHPCIWAPALAVGVTVAGYLVLDPSRIPRGISVGNNVQDSVMDLLEQCQFFLLEAGFIGAAILAIRWSSVIFLALVVLALLPLIYLGAGNDLVMRASIPSLAVLTIGACFGLLDKSSDLRGVRKKLVLGGVLVIGAVTPIAEFARAAILPTWPKDLRATLIGVSCGTYSPNYVARLGDELVAHVLRKPHRLAAGPDACDNPALDLMWGGDVR